MNTKLALSVEEFQPFSRKVNEKSVSLCPNPSRKARVALEKKHFREYITKVNLYNKDRK